MVPLSPLPATLASLIPTLLSAVTKERYEGFAGTIVVSGLSHGAPAQLSCVSCLCL